MSNKDNLISAIEFCKKTSQAAKLCSLLTDVDQQDTCGNI